jgi:hypothetical protein
LWLKTKAVELIIRNKSTQNWKKILLHIILFVKSYGWPGLCGTNSSKQFQFVFCCTKCYRFSHFCTNIIGNFLPSPYLFSEFIYFNPVINDNFLNN